MSVKCLVGLICKARHRAYQVCWNFCPSHGGVRLAVTKFTLREKQNVNGYLISPVPTTLSLSGKWRCSGQLWLLYPLLLVKEYNCLIEQKKINHLGLSSLFPHSLQLIIFSSLAQVEFSMILFTFGHVKLLDFMGDLLSLWAQMFCQ